MDLYPPCLVDAPSLSLEAYLSGENELPLRAPFESRTPDESRDTPMKNHDSAASPFSSPNQALSNISQQAESRSTTVIDESTPGQQKSESNVGRSLGI